MAEVSQADKALTQASAEDSRPVYEVGFHVVPTVEEGNVGGVVEAIRAELAKGNAEIITEQFPQKIALAYTIERAAAGKREKYSSAYFGAIKFAIDREHIPALEAMLRGNKQILRHLLIETVREEATVSRRAVFASNRLEGETIKKPTAAPETPKEVSEEELQKSIDALVS
jgi:ribosomal protein S6